MGIRSKLLNVELENGYVNLFYNVGNVSFFVTCLCHLNGSCTSDTRLNCLIAGAALTVIFSLFYLSFWRVSLTEGEL